MKQPKYLPLRMGEKRFADNYGKRMMRFDKWKADQERKLKQLL